MSELQLKRREKLADTLQRSAHRLWLSDRARLREELATRRTREAEWMRQRLDEAAS
jgi:hypothetical protein